MRLRVFLLCACLGWQPSDGGAQRPVPATPSQPDGITRTVLAIEHAIETGDADALRALARPGMRASQLSEFVQSMTFPKATRSALKERDRMVTDAGRVRLLLEILTDREAEGRVSTWRVDLDPPAAGTDGTLIVRSSPDLGSNATRSVKVPPVSTPTIHSAIARS